MTSAPISVLLERKQQSLHYVPSAATVAEAVAEMNHYHIGSVLVVDRGDLVGIFTERDVLRRVVGAGIRPDTSRVAEVMTKDLVTIGPETTVEEVMSLFTEKRCRHLPVLQDGRLVGLISIGDVTRWMADFHTTECEYLKSYIAGGFSAAN